MLVVNCELKPAGGILYSHKLTTFLSLILSYCSPVLKKAKCWCTEFSLSCKKCRPRNKIIEAVIFHFNGTATCNCVFCSFMAHLSFQMRIDQTIRCSLSCSFHGWALDYKKSAWWPLSSTFLEVITPWEKYWSVLLGSSEIRSYFLWFHHSEILNVWRLQHRT